MPGSRSLSELFRPEACKLPRKKYLDKARVLTHTVKFPQVIHPTNNNTIGVMNSRQDDRCDSANYTSSDNESESGSDTNVRIKPTDPMKISHATEKRRMPRSPQNTSNNYILTREEAKQKYLVLLQNIPTKTPEGIKTYLKSCPEHVIKFLRGVLVIFKAGNIAIDAECKLKILNLRVDITCHALVDNTLHPERVRKIMTNDKIVRMWKCVLPHVIKYLSQ